MRQFQMNYDDAVRALIVKQELGRLKRQGLDSFAAIEELTRKMRSREEVEQTEETKQVEQGEVEHTDILVEEKEEVSTQENEKKSETIPAAEMASPTSEKDGNETSLSLIQRIGQVSISSGNTPERKSEEQETSEHEASEDTDGEENESYAAIA
ncbi:Hypothetical protein PHPALM_9390 [Phytophthora palmivora]|nr:Hypothetical protein PHPALM_9390 [Phytophthora palmivora]